MNERTPGQAEDVQCGEGPDARYCANFWEQNAELDDLRAQLAAADRATAEFRRQCSELAGELGAARAVVREILGEFHYLHGNVPGYRAEFGRARMSHYRQRAGIGDGL